MKKGLDEAQGGGTVDCLKLLTYTDPEDGETYKVYPSKLTATIANKSKVTGFKYEDVNGIDFTNVKSIPRVFRNLKQTLRDHLRDSYIHQKASEYVRKEEVLLKLQKKKALRAGMTLGRLAYSILYRGAHIHILQWMYL